MKIIRGLWPLASAATAAGLGRSAPACALTIGNFDGVHLGHQAMLALLRQAAQARGLPSCVITFEPHPRDYFAVLHRRPELAPARIATLRDKLQALALAGIDRCVVLPFNAQLASQTAGDFIETTLLQRLGARWVLVGDDFRFGAQRQGDFALLSAAAERLGFEVQRMPSHEIWPTPPPSTDQISTDKADTGTIARPLRVSSSAVREALHLGQMVQVAALLGRPYSISGHVVRGRQLGRSLGESRPGQGDGIRTLNLRFDHWKPAASGIFVVRVWGLMPDGQALPGVANLGVRPSLDANDINRGRVLLETHCLDWPAALRHLPGGEAYGKIIRVELLHKLHDELKYDGLPALTQGIVQDCAAARAFFAARHTQTQRQTTRDRI